MDRNRKIITTSIQGIVVNIFLVIFKMIVGMLAGSIAIILDAINNLSDALSSVITIIGTKIAGKTPDKKHPFGYGRIEYISSVSISFIVLLAGITSLKESVAKIIHAEITNYTSVSLIIISVAVIVKFLFGKYVRNIGVQINAQSLIASGTDAIMDSVLSLSTLAAALMSIFFHIYIEGVFGAIISIFILKTGIEILMETMGSIIGTRVNSELSAKIKNYINTFEPVRGAYDLVLHDYGPNDMIGSIHIELDDDITAKEIHFLTRNIVRDIYKEFGILMTIGIYASNTDDNQSMHIKETILEETKKYQEILQIHGFYIDSEQKSASFDLVIDFKAEDAEYIKNEIKNSLEQKYPEYTFYILLDNDYSD
jgi:cation diffusion facilitator family transporter